MDFANSKVEGVVLAAGFSTRAGGFKMNLDLHGKTLLEKCLEPMIHVCSRIIVVGGHRIEDLYPTVAGYPQIKLVLNEKYGDGMFSSVREGIKHVCQSKFFLIPGDYPLIRRETYSDMLLVNGDIVVPCCQGKTGHPVLLKSSLIPELLETQEHTRLKDFITAKGFVRFETNDPGIRTDVDTMDDYERVLKIMRSSV